MRLMGEEGKEDLLEKAIHIESEDVEKALNKFPLNREGE
jgi:predicted kinase